MRFRDSSRGIGRGIDTCSIRCALASASQKPPGIDSTLSPSSSLMIAIAVLENESCALAALKEIEAAMSAGRHCARVSVRE